MSRRKSDCYPAKLSPPRLANVYGRKRLYALLDACRSHPVTWITGPAGSGKTTLAAGYLDARGLPSIWHQVDEGDADPATFFYYLGLSAKKAAPRCKKPLPLLTPEYLANARIFSRRYFENFCSRLREAVEWYLRGLDVDDLAEELYLGLMRVYRTLGRRAEAVKMFERCQSVFAAMLGVGPSQEMEQLRRQLGGPR